METNTDIIPKAIPNAIGYGAIGPIAIGPVSIGPNTMVRHNKIDYDMIHDMINFFLFIILLCYLYKYYTMTYKIEKMDMSLFPKDKNKDKNDTLLLKRKLEKLEMELIAEKNNFAKTNLQIERDIFLRERDVAELEDPVFPPEQRVEAAQYIFPNTMYNIKTRGEPDDYILVGLLYNTIINKNYQLFGRRIYPGAYEWEYYIRGKDITTLEIKFPIYSPNNQEIYDDTVLFVPLDNMEYRVKIYNYDSPRYNPYPYYG
jgi:hypothetical protein